MQSLRKTDSGWGYHWRRSLLDWNSFLHSLACSQVTRVAPAILSKKEKLLGRLQTGVMHARYLNTMITKIINSWNWFVKWSTEDHTRPLGALFPLVALTCYHSLTSRTSFVRVSTVYAQRGSRRRVGGLVVREPLGIKLFNLLFMPYPLRLPHCLPPLVSSSLSSLRSSNRPTVAMANLMVAEIIVVAGDHLSSGPSFVLFDHPLPIE